MLHELYLFLLVVSTVRICLSPFDNQTKYFAVKLQVTFEQYVVQSSYSPLQHSPHVCLCVDIARVSSSQISVILVPSLKFCNITGDLQENLSGIIECYVNRTISTCRESVRGKGMRKVFTCLFQQFYIYSPEAKQKCKERVFYQ